MRRAGAEFGQLAGPVSIAGPSPYRPRNGSGPLGLVEWSRLFLIARYENLGDDGMDRRKLDAYRLVWPNRSI
jgi:hypothetical protein